MFVSIAVAFACLAVVGILFPLLVLDVASARFARLDLPQVWAWSAAVFAIAQNATTTTYACAHFALTPTHGWRQSLGCSQHHFF